MIIHQMLPCFSYGDAIGDDTLALQKIFRSQGHVSRIYAGIVNHRFVDDALPWKKHRESSNSDQFLVYHFSIGSEITEYLLEMPDRLILVFHNITPAFWFSGLCPHLTEVTSDGIQQLALLKDKTEVAWADSEFNARTLREIGFRTVRHLPIVFDLDRFNLDSDPVFSKMYESSRKTWLFTGRVVPNKCHQDIIKAFGIYHKTIDSHSRLLLVGDNKNCRHYTESLLDLVYRLQIPEVYFTGMISDAELVSAFKMADLFICMSEHEGFCVPLLEAMYFQIPVLAFSAGAVPGTMDGAGVLVHEKRHSEIAEIAGNLIFDESLREQVICAQNKRLHRFRSLDIPARVACLLKELNP